MLHRHSHHCFAFHLLTPKHESAEGEACAAKAHSKAGQMHESKAHLQGSASQENRSRIHQAECHHVLRRRTWHYSEAKKGMLLWAH